MKKKIVITLCTITLLSGVYMDSHQQVADYSQIPAIENDQLELEELAQMKRDTIITDKATVTSVYNDVVEVEYQGNTYGFYGENFTVDQEINITMENGKIVEVWI